MTSFHDLTYLFSDKGPFAQQTPTYRVRKEQIELAQAIAKTIRQHQTLVAEAGTGTGKTWAYLVPALLSQEKVIVSTGTKALQEQLFYKDLPQVRQALGLPIYAALLKGRSNYLCHYYFERLSTDPEGLRGREEIPQFQKIKLFAKKTKTGDKIECQGVPENAPIWQRVTSTGENCLREECPYRTECFLYKARQQALDADIVVVNHALCVANLALQKTKQKILPFAPVVIFDEAHQLPDIVSNAFGLQISTSRIEVWLKELKLALLTHAKVSRKLWGDPLYALEKGLLEFKFQMRFLKDLPSQRLGMNQSDANKKLAPLPVFIALLSTLIKAVAKIDKSHIDLEVAKTMAVSILEDLSLWGKSAGVDTSLDDQVRQIVKETKDQVNAQEGEGIESPASLSNEVRKDSMKQGANVCWVSMSEKGHILFQMAPLQINFFGQFKDPDQAWIFTSATVSVNKDFRYFMRDLGLKNAQSQSWDSPFNYFENSLMYVPSHLPVPNDASFYTKLVQEVFPFIQINQGGTLILCTSLRAIDVIGDLLEKAFKTSKIKRTIFRQGQDTHGYLIESFKRQKRAVLIGSASFWEGVDFPGDQVKLVVVDKLPFQSPDDPLLDARITDYKKQGKNPFMEIQVPHAAISMKQGSGRLIRTETDKGVLIIGDHRLLTKHYGSMIWQGLPEYKRTNLAERALALAHPLLK